MAAAVYGAPWCHDGISIRELSLQHAQKTGRDAWGREKEQPLLLSVAISLKRPFASAADKDALDDSTMHYGHLAKRLRALQPSKSETLDELATRVQTQIAHNASSSALVRKCQVEISLPKASLLGERVAYVQTMSYEETSPSVESRVLHLSRLRIPVLIGVNANERTRKQPLVFDLWVSELSPGHADSYPILESHLDEIIESTWFETLESLALYIMQEIHGRFAAQAMPGSSIRLRIEKPMAVPYASAPVIEVFRSAAELQSVRDADHVQQATPLRIIRPYIG